MTFAMKMKTNSIVGVVMAIALLSGCSMATSPKFAQGSNDRRREIGLPVIETQWENYNKEFNGREAAWRAPGSNSHGPRHAGKKVLYESGQWALEQDYYYSGRTFPSLDPDAGTESEQVIVSYAFIERPGYPKGWTCRYHGPTNFMDRIGLDEADRILTSWGIKRLN